MVAVPLSACALRLHPGDDLKASLDRVAVDHALTAACILTCMGSLSQATLRLAGTAKSLILEGPLEIVSLTGTLSPDGSHLHLSVADSNGAVLGGHVQECCIVMTTAEVVVGTLHETRFSREFDPATGYQELVIRENRG